MPVSPGPSPPPGNPPRTARRRLFGDRVARWTIAAGGVAIIASILGILLFILAEVLPLLRPATVHWETPVTLAPDDRPLALLVDEHRSRIVTLDADAIVRSRDRQGRELGRHVLKPPTPAVTSAEEASPAADPASPPAPLVAAVTTPGDSLFVAAFADGALALQGLRFPVAFEGNERVVETRFDETLWFRFPFPLMPDTAFSGRRQGHGGVAAAVAPDGRIHLLRRSVRHALMGGAGQIQESATTIETGGRADRLLIDSAGRALYAVVDGRRLLRWTLGDGGDPGPPAAAEVSGAEVTALSLLIGDRSLVLGRADGGIEVWFPLRDAAGGGGFRLERARQLPPLAAPVLRIAPSLRNKGFVALAAGEAGLYHSTTSRRLWHGELPVDGALDIAFGPKADGFEVAATGSLASAAVDNPHPEISWRTLFGKVWYEGADGPSHTWQSTGGSDDFEPKLSLTPLLIGTLKGTFYSLLLAIPLGVFGAMYASQFMHPRLLRYVKPTVEIMAALPSVVLGFLAGLWLAPRLERFFPALILAAVLIPLAVLAAGAAWQLLPRRLRGRFWTGSEVLLFALAIGLALGTAATLSLPVEAALFDGSFPEWLRQTLGLHYDQRNAVVIGLAMGFAVIPIIFAISEDAFSNVPRNLVAGSLALGANRWQTVTRVVLPSASPGIFSAIMIGFGRAVGETMIVLMATGNTPIMDWNPFNGFRTLSANIAVEIAEAPQGGSLYRVLFLAALLLFLITFVINTVAEVVRQRLRRRYAEL